MKIIKATATNMKYRHGKFTSGKSIKQNNISTLYVATVVSDAVLTFYKQKKTKNYDNNNNRMPPPLCTMHCINFYALFFVFCLVLFQ